MSLLLDALKRAEQEKLARQGQEKPLEEPAPPAAAPRRRNLELEEVEPGPAVSAAKPGGERAGAKTAFAARQSVPSPAAEPGRNRVVLAIGVAALVLLAAGSAYVWLELNRVSAPVARAPASPKPVTPAPASPSSVTPPSQAPADPVPPVAVLKPENLAAAPARARPQPKAAEQLVMSLLRESGSEKPPPPLKLSRTIDPPRVSPEVSQGYDALRRGDAAGARRHYEAALAANSASVDAHLGLATAAARLGDRNAAARHYRRALDLDPKNPSAVAGLAALADFSRPEGLETQLRADITQFPSSAALHFTLGNLYASQGRWNEAQAAYFDAYRLDPEGADLAYNLAVSLDHLGQTKLAADFYQRALAAARQHNAQFDKGQVSRRIAELKP